MTNERQHESEDGPDQPELKRQRVEGSSSSNGTSPQLFVKHSNSGQLIEDNTIGQAAGQDQLNE